MVTATAEVPTRHRAGIFDPRTEGPAQEHKVGHGPQWIGGASGIGWYSYFRDATTSEVYRVYCWDGVNGGKDAYAEKDDEWRQKCYRAIIERTHAETKTGQTVVYVSRNEWAIMTGFTHGVWLETAENARDGKESKEDALNGGFIGMCRGIPVVCDLKREDILPSRE